MTRAVLFYCLLIQALTGSISDVETRTWKQSSWFYCFSVLRFLTQGARGERIKDGDGDQGVCGGQRAGP